MQKINKEVLKNIGAIIVDDIACKNLFDKYDYVVGEYIPTNGTDEELATSTGAVKTTNWISCEASTNYTIQGGNRRRIQFKLSDGTISYYSNSKDSGVVLTFVTPSECKYFRIYFANADWEGTIDEVQIEKGKVATKVVPHKEFDSGSFSELIKMKGILPTGISFDDLMASGKSTCYAVVAENKTETLKGFPSGMYGYGTVITFNSRKTANSDTYGTVQIYVTDWLHTSTTMETRGIFIRCRTSGYNWIRLSGTAVAPIT